MANCKTIGVFQPSHCTGLLYDAIHGWMMGRMDGKLHEKGPRRPLIYVMLKIEKKKLIQSCFYSGGVRLKVPKLS